MPEPQSRTIIAVDELGGEFVNLLVVFEILVRTIGTDPLAGTPRTPPVKRLLHPGVYILQFCYQRQTTTHLFLPDTLVDRVHPMLAKLPCTVASCITNPITAPEKGSMRESGGRKNTLFLQSATAEFQPLSSAIDWTTLHMGPDMIKSFRYLFQTQP